MSFVGGTLRPTMQCETALSAHASWVVVISSQQAPAYHLLIIIDQSLSTILSSLNNRLQYGAARIQRNYSF